MPSENTEQRKLAAIMFTDMVGYSALSQRNDRLALELLEEHRQLLREIFPRFNGTEIKTIGDAFLIEFSSALEAAQCAIEIQRALAKRNHDVSADRRIELKIGIHIGDVVHRGGDVYGDGVNIASRIEPLAGAGGICVSMDVERQIRNALEARFEKLALTELKNISVTMDLFRIVLPWEKQPTLGGRSRATSGARPNKGIWVAVAIILLLMIGIGWWWTTQPQRTSTGRVEGGAPTTPGSVTSSQGGLGGARPSISEKSIAVLPFENLSSDKENAYFAEGIQDEILTRLAKIGALKVISRTSTVHYASSPDNLPEIGKQLGVSSILEGSVQKAGQEVHINVQLIKAATDTHLWADSYNRKLDDIFAVEGEVAGVIAEQLDARLSGREKESLAAKPTSNTAAHDAYLRGLAFEGRVDSLLPNTLASIKAYEEAVRLDPDFGLAWAHLCRQHGFLWNLADRTPANKEAARQALAMAKKLAPDAVETELAEAFYHYWVERDYEGAKTLLESARQQFPNNPWPAYTLAAIARRQNHWEESRRLFAQAVELDPEDVFLLVDASLTDIALRDPVQALKLLARARDLSPQNGGVMFAEATSYLLTGDTTHAQAALDRAPPEEGDDNLVVTIVTTAILSRNYQPALSIMSAQLAKPKALGASLGDFQNLLGDLQRHAGNASAAQTYAQARASLEKALQTQPNDPDLTMSLAWSETWLGDKDDALAHAQQAITIVPATKDAWIGPDYEDTLARIEAHFGDKDSAIAAIRHLLSISYGLPPITPALLRLDPDWDNLRDDPRFQTLTKSPPAAAKNGAK